MTNYLDTESVDAVFNLFARTAPLASRIIFTYVHAGVLDGRFDTPGLARLTGVLRAYGETWSEAQINPAILSSVQEGFEGPRGQLAQLIRRAQAAKQLTSKFDADSIAHTMIALFYGAVLQKLWKPDIDSEAQFAVFEHFLSSLNSNSRTQARKNQLSKESARVANFYVAFGPFVGINHFT